MDRSSVRGCRTPSLRQRPPKTPTERLYRIEQTGPGEAADAEQNRRARYENTDDGEGLAESEQADDWSCPRTMSGDEFGRRRYQVIHATLALPAIPREATSSDRMVTLAMAVAFPTARRGHPLR